MLQAASGSSFLFHSTSAHFDSALLHLSARLTHSYFAMRACTRPPRIRFASSRCSFAFSHIQECLGILAARCASCNCMTYFYCAPLQSCRRLYQLGD
ncbi:hypothetical protein DWX30_06965 [Dorea formicigenerans]|nr:hypothetical protein DWX30_06965 [Dorea formicigenerans]